MAFRLVERTPSSGSSPLPAGWWLAPGALLGLALWAGLAALIL